MNEVIKLILIAIGAYALGNINPAIIIGKLHHIDIRKEGSGNAGMTNTIRVIGLGAGIAVFVIDVLKAFIAVKLGILIAGDLSGGMVAFAAVVLGHVYPALYGFKGGKGVAASLGAALALNWQSALAAVAIAGLSFLISGKRMSVASITAVICYPLLLSLLQDDKRLVYFGLAAAVFLVIQHTANIRRIAKGEEEALTIGHADQSGINDSNNDEDRRHSEGKEDTE